METSNLPAKFCIDASTITIDAEEIESLLIYDSPFWLCLTSLKTKWVKSQQIWTRLSAHFKTNPAIPNYIDTLDCYFNVLSFANIESFWL